MQRKILAAAFFALSVGSSYATPFPTLSSDVGICDPNNPTHCIAPDASGNVPITGTISASLGGFTPSASGARGAPLSVTTSDSTGTLPTGAVTIVSNVGTTNPMYCNVNGVAATTSDQLIAANSWFAFTIPATITALHCIATGGTTTANMLGGAGLATGAGGGSGGSGGGGAITAASGSYASGALSSGSVASGAYASGSIGSGAMVDLGAVADATGTVGGAGTLSAKLRLMTSQLDSINTNISGPTPAGTNVIGKVGIDPTANLVSSADYTTMPPGTSAPLAVPGQGVFAGVPFRLYDKGNAPTGSGTNSCAASCNSTTMFTGDFSDFAEISVQMTSIGVGGAITFQESNDNFAATANSAQCVQRSSVGATSPITTTQNALGIVTCKIGARYFRAQFTSYTSGTYTVFWAAGKETGTSNVQPVFLAGSPDIGFVLDTAATVGSTGTLNAKLRLMTSQLDTLNTNVTASIPAGTALIGHVITDTGSTTAVTALPAIPTGSNVIGALTANQSVNVAQINGVTTLMNAGASGTGSQRVSVADDNSSVAINISTATTTQLVAISGSTSIYVTSWDVIAGGTGNIQLVYGTGSNCATGQTILTGAYNLTAQAGIAKGSGSGTILKTPASQALCAVTSAAVQMSGSMSFKQF